MYNAVKRNNKAGEAWRAYMVAMPAFCHKSTVRLLCELGIGL